MHHHHFHHGEKDHVVEWEGKFHKTVDPPKRPLSYKSVKPEDYHQADNQKLPYYLSMRSNNPLPSVNY